ncbi:MAG: hypothetical protein EBZ77_14810 [Chitinophagia bacterium]|nr:hypothetical protein [Chitinophagia bacterium]
MAVLLSGGVAAQSVRSFWEAEGGAGIFTLSDLTTGIPALRDEQQHTLRFGAVYQVQARRYLSPLTAVGLSASWHSFSHTHYDADEHKMVEDIRNPLSLACEIKQVYETWNRHNMQFYATGGAALQFDTYPGNSKAFQPAWYLSLVGFRIGHTNGLYAQLGLGYRGLLCGGYSLRVGKSANRRHGPVPVDREVNFIY